MSNKNNKKLYMSGSGHLFTRDQFKTIFPGELQSRRIPSMRFINLTQDNSKLKRDRRRTSSFSKIEDLERKSKRQKLDDF